MEILEFLKEWSPYIVSGLIVVLDLLILLLKNRPKTIDDFLDALKNVLNKLPEIIVDFEVPGNGEKKKEKVLDYSLDLLPRLLHRGLSVRESSYSAKVISEQIEKILSTPQKKGDL